MKGSEKINLLLNHFSLNPSDFAKILGLKYVQNIYDIQKDRADISKQMAAKIAAAFPDIDKNWLLTGEGEMINKSIVNSGTNNGVLVSGDFNQINLCEEKLKSAQLEIQYLKDTIKDKEEIIELLKTKIKP
jgi:hypothetical protein